VSRQHPFTGLSSRIALRRRHHAADRPRVATKNVPMRALLCQGDRAARRDTVSQSQCANCPWAWSSRDPRGLRGAVSALVSSHTPPPLSTVSPVPPAEFAPVSAKARPRSNDHRHRCLSMPRAAANIGADWLLQSLCPAGRIKVPSCSDPMALFEAYTGEVLTACRCNDDGCRHARSCAPLANLRAFRH